MIKNLVLGIILIYQRYISPRKGLLGLLFGGESWCRYQPSCSEYTRIAVSQYGIGKGLWLGLLRIIRCHPFAKGGEDPVL